MIYDLLALLDQVVVAKLLLIDIFFSSYFVVKEKSSINFFSL